MIVSVHLPKTGGSSFREILRQRFGERLLLDYDDQPLAQEKAQRNQQAQSQAVSTHESLIGRYDCIHGHFLPLKYIGIENVRFITWLREPVERVVSRYFFTRRNWKDSGIPPAHPELRKLFDQTGDYPGLEEFVRVPAFQNTYAQYLWGFKLERFEHIGFVESWQKSMQSLTDIIGLEAGSDVRVNVNPSRGDASYEIDASLRELIEELNRKDVELYQRALALFS